MPCFSTRAGVTTGSDMEGKECHVTGPSVDENCAPAVPQDANFGTNGADARRRPERARGSFANFAKRSQSKRARWGSFGTNWHVLRSSGRWDFREFREHFGVRG